MRTPDEIPPEDSEFRRKMSDSLLAPTPFTSSADSEETALRRIAAKVRLLRDRIARDAAVARKSDPVRKRVGQEPLGPEFQNLVEVADEILDGIASIRKFKPEFERASAGARKILSLNRKDLQ